MNPRPEGNNNNNLLIGCSIIRVVYIEVLLLDVYYMMQLKYKGFKLKSIYTIQLKYKKFKLKSYCFRSKGCSSDFKVC